MTDPKPKTQAKTEKNPKTDPTPAMTQVLDQWQQAGLSAMNWMGAGWLERMSDLGSEWMTFLSERVAEDVKFQHALLHASSPTELHQLQADFVQKAIDQYTAETGKMIELTGKLFTPPTEE